ncbi:hypothetical protein BBJ28_00020686 [Nothophytophthora sp. Chile5]|nr:hypothetical protein BBJ28_00020686 [Nothophytophthora sp. Chile5]
MIEATLEEEVYACDQDFQSCYRAVLSSLREDRPADSTCADKSTLQSLEAQEQQIAAMVDAVGGAECPDEMLRLEVAASFRDLYTELRADLAQYEREFVSAASAGDAAGSREAATSKGGGWNEADEERFVKVLRGFERKQGAGRNPQLLYDQLMAVLPAISLKEIMKHVKFHQHLRFHKQKSKDRQREFQRRMQELQTEVREQIRVAVEQEQEKEQKLQQWQTQQQQCQQLQGQVAQWRVTKEAKERIEQQQREIERVMEEQAKQEEELHWKRKLAQQRLVVEDYKSVRLGLQYILELLFGGYCFILTSCFAAVCCRKEKVLGRMAGEKVLVEEEQKREAERAVQSVVNAERVEYRHNELQVGGHSLSCASNPSADSVSHLVAC